MENKTETGDSLHIEGAVKRMLVQTEVALAWNWEYV